MNPKDERLEKVEEITIEWATFKKALERNYLSDDYYGQRQDRTFVLRLYPPFEKEMKVEYYESMQGRRYNNEWKEKPYHIRPELILLEGTEKGTRPFKWVSWPTQTWAESFKTDENVHETVEEIIEIEKEFFWNEMKSFLPETYELGLSNSIPENKEVKINWIGLDEE